MCTASWWIGSGRAELCFNRDERKDRPQSLPPRIRPARSTHCVWPEDPVSGGTWILASERGLCVFVMNLYSAEAAAPAPAPRRSRGELPILLAEAASADAAAARVPELDFRAYPPFLVGMLDPHGCRALAWDGLALREEPTDGGFLTTSSFRTEEVQAYRKRRYEAAVAPRAGDFAARRAYHFERAHPQGAFDPLMRRAESETRSVCLLRSDGARWEFEYCAREADSDSWLAPVALELPLREAARR